MYVLLRSFQRLNRFIQKVVKIKNINNVITYNQMLREDNEKIVSTIGRW